MREQENLKNLPVQWMESIIVTVVARHARERIEECSSKYDFGDKLTPMGQRHFDLISGNSTTGQLRRAAAEFQSQLG